MEGKGKMSQQDCASTVSVFHICLFVGTASPVWMNSFKKNIYIVARTTTESSLFPSSTQVLDCTLVIKLGGVIFSS